MKQRIFKGSFLVGISVWLSCLVLILGALYVQYNDEYSKELKNEAYIVGHAVEIGGKDYFQQLNVGEGHRITWIKVTEKYFGILRRNRRKWKITKNGRRSWKL